MLPEKCRRNPARLQAGEDVKSAKRGKAASPQRIGADLRLLIRTDAGACARPARVLTFQSRAAGDDIDNTCHKLFNSSASSLLTNPFNTQASSSDSDSNRIP